MVTEQPLFGVTGWKNAGKTTLVVRLVEHLSGRGWNVSTVKHAHHTFDVDHEGRDSWKHRKAGARETAVVSRARWALMHELAGEEEPPLEEILAKMAHVDLVLVEGYKREHHPKIEILSAGSLRDAPRWREDGTIVALAGVDRPADASLPCFHPDDIRGIADFVLDYLGLERHEEAFADG